VCSAQRPCFLDCLLPLPSSNLRTMHSTVLLLWALVFSIALSFHPVTAQESDSVRRAVSSWTSVEVQPHGVQIPLNRRLMRSQAPSQKTQVRPRGESLSDVSSGAGNKASNTAKSNSAAHPLSWNIPLVEVTCRFTADGTIGRVHYDDKDLTALVTAVTSGWRTTKTLKFIEKPGAVLTVEGTAKGRVHGCLNSGMQVACTTNSTKRVSIWDRMTSNSTQWSAIGRAFGRFRADELHGKGGPVWKRPCEARSTHLHLAPGVKKIWAPAGTKYALMKFPTWGHVLCKFMLDDHVESVYYNGQDITAKVEAFNSQAKKTKIIRFPEVPDAVLTIEGRSAEKNRINRCTKSGLQIVCVSSVMGSVWNWVSSNRGWQVKGSNTGNFDAKSVKGKGAFWFWPCRSRKGKKLQGSPNL